MLFVPFNFDTFIMKQMVYLIDYEKRSSVSFEMAAVASGLSSANGDAVVNRNPAPLFYVCGRFLSLKKPVVVPSFTTAISTIWNLKERISVVEEEAGVFVFLFKDKEEKQRVLDGGP